MTDLRRDRRLAIGIFALLFVTYAWFFGGGGWNQNAHFDLTRAMVERQTFHIDGYRVNTGDISWSPQAHAYSNKPPGMPFLAAIPYWVLHKIESARFLPYDGWYWMTVNVYVLQLAVCATTGAGLAVLMFLWARRRANVSQRMALFVALIGGFATIVFPYSTAFFSPVPAAFFLMLGLLLLDDRPALAGAAVGISGVCFYYGILAAGIMAVALLIRSRRALLLFIAGGLPFGALLAWYHTVCFGAPWKTSLSVATNFTHKGLFLGLFASYPTKAGLWGLTFSEYRGLFYVSPVLLLAFVGMFGMIRKRVLLRDLAIIVTTSTVFLLLTSSFNGWDGGGSFGPRHILPAVPLLALPIVFLRGRALIAVAVVLTVVSASIQFLATAVDPTPPGGIPDPIGMYYVPLFRTGRIPAETMPLAYTKYDRLGKVAVNVQAVDELVPHWQHPPGSRESTWASFNLGEFIFGPGSRTSVLPIALWMIFGSALLVRTARTA
jgi:hypothetical protein